MKNKINIIGIIILLVAYTNLAFDYTFMFYYGTYLNIATFIGLMFLIFSLKIKKPERFENQFYKKIIK